MSKLLPPPIPETVNQLMETWGEDWLKIKTDEASVQKISEEIDKSRHALVDYISHLQ